MLLPTKIEVGKESKVESNKKEAGLNVSEMVGLPWREKT